MKKIYKFQRTVQQTLLVSADSNEEANIIALQHLNKIVPEEMENCHLHYDQSKILDCVNEGWDG